ncbi:hypothetical protein IV494_08065 [Kaistella sp. G5-32]|uniref:Phage abortive infection protein n=1 Tax=Kaistella gelatinilytica TaxID=2787636 RepID=A0ABS0FBP4_9FLAO|nr:hypothetical protein [Kaistella gelatinilytica]MBF8457137.1 hypothetical protein [Kaistella gelatinilytica]
MITKINKFFVFLDDLRSLFLNQFKNNSENEEAFIEEIKLFYLTYKDLFPFDIKSAFELVRLEYDVDKTKSIFWDKLKDSYHNYEAFIEMDYTFLKSNLYDISDLNQRLFNHTKVLSANYYFLLAHDYYFHFGKSKSRETTSISVYLFNYYHENLTKFDELENEKKIQILKDHYQYQYEKIELETRQKYTEYDISLEIIEPQYIDGDTFNFELEKLNKQYISQLVLLKDYKKNIKLFSRGLKFEFPEFVQHSIVRITFNFPQEVYDCLELYLSSISFRNNLKQLIFGEIDNSLTKIRLNCQSNSLSHFFGILREKGITSITNPQEIAEWIVQNFQYKKAGDYKNFTVSSVTTWLKPNKHLPDSERIKNSF